MLKPYSQLWVVVTQDEKYEVTDDPNDNDRIVGWTYNHPSYISDAINYKAYYDTPLFKPYNDYQ